MSSWIDESLVLSELAGVVLLLVMAWIVVIKNQLWQHWLRLRYQPALEHVAGQLQLREQRSWRARLEARGRRGSVKLSVQWRAGVGPHKLLIRAKRRFKRRSWVGAPDTPPSELVRHAERLVNEL